MGYFSQLHAAIEDEEVDFIPEYLPETMPVRTEDEHVPMSKTRLFDNSSAWLDAEPWRKW